MPNLLTTDQKVGGSSPSKRTETQEDLHNFLGFFISTSASFGLSLLPRTLWVSAETSKPADKAKEPYPKLSTWYQSKTTKARSYNGRVLLVLKTPKDKAD